MSGEILAFDGNRRNNAQAIRDAHQLGWVADEDRVLDLSYRKGRFWGLYRPPRLTTNDLDAKFETDLTLDYRATDAWDHLVGAYDVVVFDPPYGYRGTSRHAMDESYGLGEYLSVHEREEMFEDGCETAVSLFPERILVKCMDQVVSGKKRWQRRMFADWIERKDGDFRVWLEFHCYRLADELHVCGGVRSQRGAQKNSRSNVSTLQLYVRETKR